ncbi:MAG TPA: hypothetical protein DCL54_08490, partial [Alphaproteobacteria bacterium]|nr:hypothetical protein [Alphaproteobacteria bacterium]HAJ46603.1 hypothetical protein [Alphaproteobacteria bacterium]
MARTGHTGSRQNGAAASGGTTEAIYPVWRRGRALRQFYANDNAPPWPERLLTILRRRRVKMVAAFIALTASLVLLTHAW